MYRLLVLLMLTLNSAFLSAQVMQTAPGRPGQDAHWPSAAKDGFGTANTMASKVWFTLSAGLLTEVFYPRVDTPNVQALQFIVVTPSGVETESANTSHEIQVLDSHSLLFRQINTANNGAYTISKTYVTDPRGPAVLIEVLFKIGNEKPAELYVYFDPSLNNSGLHDRAWTQGEALLARDGNVASALMVNTGLDEATNGFLGISDGLTLLQQGRFKIAAQGIANDGNVVQMARIRHPKRFTLALAFGKTPTEALLNARSSLSRGFARALREYNNSWHTYAASLVPVDRGYQRQFNIAAMVLKALEDKTYRGAIIASPSTPWGGGANANEATISGYHAVWSRDLYQIATALNAMGDNATANRTLDFMFNVQQKADGSFPQNTWVDGRSIGAGLQMDQVALPIILAFQLTRTDRTTWLKHLKPAADFILHYGPVTGQDRWEEKPGYSPATIAAEIAALVCAASIAAIHGEQVSATAYLRKADEWAAMVETWTATRSGPQVGASYYLRISEKGRPDDAQTLQINSGGGSYDQREIVDAGFLELVRLGIKSADDPLVRRSLAVVDRLLRVDTPVGPAWYRYNHDAYGERMDGAAYDGKNGAGRLWTLLTGERGEYEIAKGSYVEARKCLQAMVGFANGGLMLPEQVWDRRVSAAPGSQLGAGTGSATPLAWSMAQFIRLAINLRQGKNIETPELVRSRYSRSRAMNGGT